MLPSDDTDATNATVTIIVIVSSTTSDSWMPPTREQFQAACESKWLECKWPDEPASTTVQPEHVDEEREFNPLETRAGLSRRLATRPPQLASSYG